MTVNYSLGSRYMADAGRMALNAAAGRGDLSFSSAATVGDRFSTFADWARGDGINKMERIDRETVVAYGRELAGKVEAGTMAQATAQNYVSAVNTVMSLATRGEWQSVSPTRDCLLPERSAIRTDAPQAIDRPIYSRGLEAVREKLGERAAGVVEMAREFGLRSKEASLINARAARNEARERGAVTIREGSKGGRPREVPITNPRQIAALERAAEAQGTDRSMIPENESWKSWREGTLRDSREIVQHHTGGGLHDLRAAYACQRFQELTGQAAPCAAGARVDKDVNLAARQQIASELGHGRIGVTNEYLGAR